MKKKHSLLFTVLSLVFVLIFGTPKVFTDKPAADPTPQTQLPQSDREPQPAPLPAGKIDGEKILARAGYTCSYNTTTRQPNYVSWTLTPAKLQGTVKRSSRFYEDPDLEDSEKSTPDDYYNSGYDRGHMCPAADNKWSEEAMEQSFYLSNMCPQKHTLNSGDWETLESACRDRVRDHGVTLHIVCGPIFDSPKPKRINKRIPVPDRFFKAIVCLDKGNEQGIGFIYTNNSEKHPMEYYACPIDTIERITGYDLFATLGKKQQRELEAQSDLKDWNF